MSRLSGGLILFDEVDPVDRDGVGDAAQGLAAHDLAEGFCRGPAEDPKADEPATDAPQPRLCRLLLVGV